MISLRLILDGDGSGADLRERGMTPVITEGQARLIYLPHGMESGLPSCAFIFELEGGKQYVFAELSVWLLIEGARAMQVKAQMEGHDL